MPDTSTTITLTLSRPQNQRTGEEAFAEAEMHLQEALSRDRKIGLVELEAPILLESQNSDKTAFADAIAKVKEHTEKARERAWCDDTPFYFKVAYEKAE